LHEIRPLFYGLTRRQIIERRLEYEDSFLGFTNSVIGRELYRGAVASPPIVALLIFFLSLFERAGLYNMVNAIAPMLPSGPLKQQIEALFEYKNIQNASTDYLNKFDRVLSLLQAAWNASDNFGRMLCKDLVREYVLDAALEPQNADGEIRAAIAGRLHESEIQLRFPILRESLAGSLASENISDLHRTRSSVRVRIVESLHALACQLVPETLLTRVADEFAGEARQEIQHFDRIPRHLSDQLEVMGSFYNPQWRGARLNYGSDHTRNQMYLGTYFPRSVIESWNIFADLLSIPEIQASLRQKDYIRLLDLGSGTGAAVVGALLALNDWGECDSVEVTSIDINRDALLKQEEILDNLRHHISLDYVANCREEVLPFDLENYVPALSGIADQERRGYDLITCWKFLCEFYNVNYASAQGIIRNTISIASNMLAPYGLMVVSDVTTSDNGYELFAFTLNREANEHDSSPDATARTVLPLPCGRCSITCRETRCYTQRCFQVRHRLASNDKTKIAYRVFAPEAFARSIINSFTQTQAYRVNAARPLEACCDGSKNTSSKAVPCGYTGFFAEG
jgi:hypothetical protein